MADGTTNRKPLNGSGARPRAIQSLLVPVDLTPSSDRVLGRLPLLPLADHCKLTLLHVVPGNLPPSDQRRAERDAKRALAAEVTHLRKQLQRHVQIEALVKLGAPARQIAMCATKHKAELVVMGRCGARPLRELFLGSTAERVVRQAKLPVLVVRLPARKRYARPALALDFDEAAPEVLRFTLLVLPPPRPRIEVIHAFDAPYGLRTYPSLTRTEMEEWETQERFRSTQKLAKLLAGALVQPDDAPSWKTHLRYGSPRAVVEKAVSRVEPDLLVLGTHGYSGVAYMFLGTIAGDLLRAAKCDVLMVPPNRRR
jgi:nucleotide-binding universal stress UspA family protein